MPSRNIYAEGIDFRRLASDAPSFQPYLNHKGQLNFRDPAAVKQLTTSLLERDFQLRIALPDDRLCPPVPNRLSYILWVQDLIDSTGGKFTDEYDAERDVTGLDIGTGASCIYALLGCATRPKWKFVATDIDGNNFQSATRNVRENQLGGRIRLLHTTQQDPLIPLDKIGLDSIVFTMCNPPFYSSASDMLESAVAKARPPHSACTGAEVEMVTSGGEVAFVERMVQESKALLHRVQWYTTMLGKLSSVATVVENLRAKGVSNWAVREFMHGEKTRRWGVAWSWHGSRPSVAVARGTSAIPKELLPFPSEQTITIPQSNRDAVVEQVNEALSKLDLRWRYRGNLHQGVGIASKDVWSRAARRKRQRELASGAAKHGSNESEEDEPALSFKLSFTASETEAVILVRWLGGQDSVLFESFCGMLHRILIPSN